MLSGVLIIPILIVILQIPVVPEQWLANLLLNENLPIETSRSRDSLLLRPWRLLVTASAWKRLLYVLLKIPLGAASFFAFFNVLVPIVALFGMPLIYVVGFRNLIVGPWRFDTVEEVLLAFLAGLLLLPLSIYALNLLARISAWLAQILLPS